MHLVGCFIQRNFAAIFHHMPQDVPRSPLKEKKKTSSGIKLTDLMYLLLILLMLFLREMNHVPNYTQVTEQNRTEGMPPYY